jgi:putative CocE/NonD family hydrolase
MSQNLHTIRIEHGISVPMKDGTSLPADLYRPDDHGEFPVVLQRTPYDRTNRRRTGIADPVFLAQNGYAVVIQDVRGRYGSPGLFQPFFQELSDGYDTVQWCANQIWSNGKVGMNGASYVGATQWLAACTQPEGLTCIVPTATSDDYYEGWTYQGGAFQLGFTSSWSLNGLTLENLVRISQNTNVPDNTKDDLIFATDNLRDILQICPLDSARYLPLNLAPYFYEWINHPMMDDYWRFTRITDRHPQIKIPALNIGGWFDIFLGGTIRNYTGMSENGGSDMARSGQRLIIGPWSHQTIGSAITGSVQFGLRATGIGMDLLGEHLRWYDHWLKGIDNGVDREPPVRIFVMGDNVWRSEQEWPLERTKYTDYFLHSTGNANTLNGDGYLSKNLPLSEPEDAFQYDPNNPVPTDGGNLCCDAASLPGGPCIQNHIEGRGDILCYTTGALDKDIEITGPITVTLYASTDGPDTDFTAKLVDVYPEGCSIGLADGIIRARFRKSTSQSVPTSPGQVHKFVIDLASTSNVFKKGHRIRLDVSSSNFPRFDRNPNTGEYPYQATVFRTATQRVFHNGNNISYITLPIIPR